MALGAAGVRSATMLEQLLEEINFQRTKEMRQLMKDGESPHAAARHSGSALAWGSNLVFHAYNLFPQKNSYDDKLAAQW